MTKSVTDQLKRELLDIPGPGSPLSKKNYIVCKYDKKRCELVPCLLKGSCYMTY